MTPGIGRRTRGFPTRLKAADPILWQDCEPCVLHSRKVFMEVADRKHYKSQRVHDIYYVCGDFTTSSEVGEKAWDYNGNRSGRACFSSALNEPTLRWQQPATCVSQTTVSGSKTSTLVKGLKHSVQNKGDSRLANESKLHQAMKSRIWSRHWQHECYTAAQALQEPGTLLLDVCVWPIICVPGRLVLSGAFG